jgi:hypothetical protein
MPEFTLTAVKPEVRYWEGEHGRFAIYDVSFEGSQGRGDAQIKQKDSSPAPTVGQTVDAEIVHKKPGFPPELKRNYQQGGRGGGGSGGWKSKSPEEVKAINRAVAQKNAILLLGVEVQAGKAFALEQGQDFAVGLLAPLLKSRVDWLFEDLQKAGEAS